MQDPIQSTSKAAVLVEIECSLKEQPPRWSTVLQKSLQSLFNKHLPLKANICDLDILPSSPFVAKVVLDSVSGKKKCPVL